MIVILLTLVFLDILLIIYIYFLHFKVFFLISYCYLTYFVSLLCSIHRCNQALPTSKFHWFLRNLLMRYPAKPIYRACFSPLSSSLSRLLKCIDLGSKRLFSMPYYLSCHGVSQQCVHFFIQIAFQIQVIAKMFVHSVLCGSEVGSKGLFFFRAIQPKLYLENLDWWHALSNDCQKNLTYVACTKQ